jgi:hypothetical protein
MTRDGSRESGISAASRNSHVPDQDRLADAAHAYRFLKLAEVAA